MLPHKSSSCTNATDIWMEATSNPRHCTLSRGAAQEPPCAGKAPCSADHSTHTLAQWLSDRTSCTWALNARAHFCPSFIPSHCRIPCSWNPWCLLQRLLWSCKSMAAISNWAASGQVLFLGNLWKMALKEKKKHSEEPELQLHWGCQSFFLPVLHYMLKYSMSA